MFSGFPTRLYPTTFVPSSCYKRDGEALRQVLPFCWVTLLPSDLPRGHTNLAIFSQIQNEPIFLEQISGTCWLDNNYKNLCFFVESLSFLPTFPRPQKPHRSKMNPIFLEQISGTCSPHHHYKKLGFLFGRLGVGGRKMFVLPNCNFKLKVELSGSCAFSNAYWWYSGAALPPCLLV